MIDMDVRWSDGWKAGNVLQIYEKAVVIFAVGFFPFFTTDNLGNRRINPINQTNYPYIYSNIKYRKAVSST